MTDSLPTEHTTNTTPSITSVKDVWSREDVHLMMEEVLSLTYRPAVAKTFERPPVTVEELQQRLDDVSEYCHLVMKTLQTATTSTTITTTTTVTSTNSIPNT